MGLRSCSSAGCAEVSEDFKDVLDRVVVSVASDCGKKIFDINQHVAIDIPWAHGLIIALACRYRNGVDARLYDRLGIPNVRCGESQLDR